MARSPLRVAVLCGGPSPERGISLNSARSVSDHLAGDDVEIVPVYFDYQRQPWQISRAQLYSNTPSDFDFKLRSSGTPLSNRSLLKVLRGSDLVFPVMHGLFGEDGGIQELLEGAKLPFVGSPSRACRRCFDKFEANELLRASGFTALPSMVIERGERGYGGRIRTFFRRHALTRAIVKPATGGSSIGVFSVGTPAEAAATVERLFASGFYKRVVVEEFCQGIEFTSVILENRFDLPVCLLPVEIEADYRKHQIFDYRKKYLPTRAVTYHCPPRFADPVLERIQSQAEQLFRMFGMRDFARFDGWVLPDGSIWFSDFNPISGMEQNSFLFLQGARVGFSHRDILRYVVHHACSRYGIPFEPVAKSRPRRRRRPINVLFGGRTAERQVSVMSGTNVWLKLRRSERFEPRPFLLDMEGYVWALPYSLTLNHTVEEISENCRSAARAEESFRVLRERVWNRLAPLPGQLSELQFLPERLTLRRFLERSEQLFIALHGGIGENGEIQALCRRLGVPFNGSGPEASRLAMDKAATGEVVRRLATLGVGTARRLRLPTRELRHLSPDRVQAVWRRLEEEVGGKAFIAKPAADGCSAGIVRIASVEDLGVYLRHLTGGSPRLPAGTLSGQGGIVEMPVDVPGHLLLEEFIETDRLNVVGHKLLWERVSGWIEVTVGVVGPRGRMRAMSPSITVASGDVLSVEEKFQGGTGINITPPPSSHVPARSVTAAKLRIEAVARALGLSGYARIDAFMEVATGRIIVIEANTLPGLTPSTVIYHQALAERPSMYPLEFLERIAALRS